MFFNEDVISLLVEESTHYAHFKNCPDPEISIEEMKCFIGILILSGYNQVPTKRSFWDSAEDLRNWRTYEISTYIMRFVHCSDNNNIDLEDKSSLDH